MSGSDDSNFIRDTSELIDTVAIDNSTAEDRLRTHLKPAFDEDGDEWSSYLEAYGNQYSEFYAARDEMLEAQFVETAEGSELDRIGEFAQLPRRTGESDDHYRQRLIVQMQKFIAGGTIPEIRSLCAILLRTPRSEITIQENFGIEPARFDIQISLDLIEESGVTPSEFVDNIWGIRAAGVRPVIQTTGSFTYRSYEDYQNGINDPEKAYNNGEYAGYLGE